MPTRRPRRAATVLVAALATAVILGCGGGGSALGLEQPPASLDPASPRLSAEGVAYDTAELAAPANEPFVIVFENREAVSHNVSIYADEGLRDRRFEGVLFGGPATRWLLAGAGVGGSSHGRAPDSQSGVARARCPQSRGRAHRTGATCRSRATEDIRGFLHRPAPAVFGMDAVHVRRPGYDRHSRSVRRRQHRVPRGRYSVGRNARWCGRLVPEELRHPAARRDGGCCPAFIDRRRHRRYPPLSSALRPNVTGLRVRYKRKATGSERHTFRSAMLPRIVTVLFCWFLITGGVSPRVARLPAPIEDAIQHVTAAELRAHVTVLASDQLAGREVGHAGNREAARYIAGALRDAKVPAAAPDYAQPVEIYEPRLGLDGRLTITGVGSAFCRAGCRFLLSAPSPFERPDSYGPASLGRPRHHGPPAPSTTTTRGSTRAARSSWCSRMRPTRCAGRRALEPGRERDGDHPPQDGRRAKARRRRAHRGAAVSRRRARSLAGPAFGPLGVLSPLRADARGAVRGRGHLGARRGPGPACAREAAAAHGHAESRRDRPPRRHVQRPRPDRRAPGWRRDGRRRRRTSITTASTRPDASTTARTTTPRAPRRCSPWRRPSRGRPRRAPGPRGRWCSRCGTAKRKDRSARSISPARRCPRAASSRTSTSTWLAADEDIPDPDDPRFRGFPRTTASQSGNVVHLLGYTYSPDLARIVDERTRRSV